MSFADERTSIENKFTNEWTSEPSRPPIAYENVDFNIPTKVVDTLPIGTIVNISGTVNYNSDNELVTESDSGWFETTQDWIADEQQGKFIILGTGGNNSEPIDIYQIINSEDEFGGADKARFYYRLGQDWVRLIIQNGDSGYRGLNNLQRHTGVIIVQIFVRKGIGNDRDTRTGREYADVVATILNNTRFDDIVTDVSSIITIDDDEVWHQTNVTTSFYRDD